MAVKHLTEIQNFINLAIFVIFHDMFSQFFLKNHLQLFSKISKKKMCVMFFSKIELKIHIFFQKFSIAWKKKGCTLLTSVQSMWNHLSGVCLGGKLSPFSGHFIKFNIRKMDSSQNSLPEKRTPHKIQYTG